MTRNHSAIPFERYADDAICHCTSEAEAAALRVSLEERFTECGLTLHPEKTKIVYCKDDDRRETYPDQKFDFLGYTVSTEIVAAEAGHVWGLVQSGGQRQSSESDPPNDPRLDATRTQ
jgi:RNA-directed DNA polymerase